jgi:hypothetical protein
LGDHLLANFSVLGALVSFFLGLGFLVLVDHLLVDAAFLLCEFGVGTILNDRAFLEDEDAICLLDSRETMGNDKCGDGAAEFDLHMVDGALHFGFVRFVESGSSFIEDQHAWLFDESTGEGKSLLLAARKLTATSADLGVDTILTL